MKTTTKIMKLIKVNLPIIIFTVLVPIAIYYTNEVIPDGIVHVLNQGETKLDMYTKFKSQLLTFSGFLMIAYLMFYYKNKDREKLKRFSIEYKMMLSLLLLVIVSTVFSSYRSVSLWGFTARYEGGIAWSIYLLAVFYIKVSSNETSRFKEILYFIKVSSILVSLIGFFEYYGHYILVQEWFKNIFASAELRSVTFSVTYRYSKTITSTLYNSNFVGSFFAVTSIIWILEVIRNKKSIFNIIGLSLSVFCLIASNSSAGFVGFAVALLLLILMNIKYVFRLKGITAIVAVVIIAMTSFVWIDSGRGNLIKTEINKLVNLEKATQSRSLFSDLTLDGDELQITFGEHIFKMKLTGKYVNFFDTYGEPLKYKMNKDEEYLTFKDESYSNIRIDILDDGQAFMYTQNRLKYFIGFDEGQLMISDAVGNIYTEFSNPETFGFEGFESLGSNRGYIWSRSLPILFDTIIIGKGADTFPFYFPQDDIIGKQNYLGGSNAFVDKPHNLFIQMGISFGMLFLGIYILLILKYTYESLKLYVNIDFTDHKKVMGLTMFIATIAFNVSGLFNDSYIGIAVIYWTVFGLGLAINSSYKEEHIKNEVLELEK